MLKTNITYHRVETIEDLKAILKLQQDNLPDALSKDEKTQEGFLTLKHTFAVLEKMNVACAHCIAKNNGKVVGYALSMLEEFKEDIPLLIPMFNEIETTYTRAKHTA